MEKLPLTYEFLPVSHCSCSDFHIFIIGSQTGDFEHLHMFLGRLYSLTAPATYQVVHLRPEVS